MTQTIPRLMSFPPERTEILLRFESGQAVANAMAAGVGLGVGNILIAFGRKPGGVEKAFGLPPNYKFTWGHAVGYPLEDPKAGGQRPPQADPAAGARGNRLFARALQSCARLCLREAHPLGPVQLRNNNFINLIKTWMA